MKKLLSLALTMVTVFTLGGCSLTADKSDKPDKPQNSDSTVQNREIEFEAEMPWVNYTSEEAVLNEDALNSDVIQGRADIIGDEVMHLPIFKCENIKELEQFTERYSDILSFSQGLDGSDTFDDVCKDYDSEFFKENTLFLVYTSAGSCSFTFGVKGVDVEDGKLIVHIEQTNDPEAYDCAMSGWLACVSVNRESIKDSTSFDADIIKK